MIDSLIGDARTRFHRAILDRVLTVSAGVPSNADSGSKASVAIARSVLALVGSETERERLAGQTSGNNFEDATVFFLRETFLRLQHLRPGGWSVARAGDSGRSDAQRQPIAISSFEQYVHLNSLSDIAKTDRHLAAALRSDYAIRPDIVVIRAPETDQYINATTTVVGDNDAPLTPLRSRNNRLPLLHACVSCKWTIRSDRVQNARSEALNLIRNRKGRAPHIVVVTGEPLPARIAAIALGTGDIDCVYHFALPELIRSVRELRYEDSQELMEIMVEGKRLRDIGDLPLDLAI